jgi:magnesium transporter
MAFRKHKPKAGSRPGTLAMPAGSPSPRIHAVCYSPAGVEEFDVEDPRSLQQHVQGERTVWIDVQGLGDEQVMRQIGDVFQMTPLALEDAVNVPQRAKSEHYEHHQLVIARIPMMDDKGNLVVPQVCFILGQRYLLTFQERYFGLFDTVRERIRAGLGPIWRMGPDYLAYALIDALVDHYYPIAEALSQQLDDLEDEITEDPGHEVLQEIHRIRRQLVIMRRVSWPQREAINALVRERTPYVSDDVRTYLRDTYDHIAQITELVDSTREMAVGLSEIYLSNVSHKTNEVMKVLTLMASIFIPLTFIAGVYGMNFEYMPELGRHDAYYLVLVVMIVIAMGMVGYFRRRGWIGAGRAKRKRGKR